MVENQHKQIKGYRDLTEEEIALMNKIKEASQEIGDLVAEVLATPGVDHRWTAIGCTDLQTGFMALTRAVAQPTSF